MGKNIATVDDLIEALGGPTKIGRLLGIKQSAVSNWRLPDREGIPPGWHLRLYLEALARGFNVDMSIFGAESTVPKKNGSAKNGRQTAFASAGR